VLNVLSYNPSDRKIEVNLNECFSNVKICNSVIAINKVLCHVKVNHNAKNTESSIYNNGITKSIKTKDNMDGIRKIVEESSSDFTGLLFVNFHHSTKVNKRRDRSPCV
jgi:hypothetical protein